MNKLAVNPPTLGSKVTPQNNDPPRDGPSKLVQMRLRPSTMERVARLQELTETENRTQAVVRAVQIADWLVTAVKAGATVSLEWPDGKKETITVVGI